MHNRQWLVVGMLVLGVSCGADELSGPFEVWGERTEDDEFGGEMHPTAVGGVQSLLIIPAEARFRSANTSVLTIERTDDLPLIRAHAEGETEVQLLGSRGDSVRDSVPLRIAKVTPWVYYAYVTELPLAALRSRSFPVWIHLSTEDGESAVDHDAVIGATGGTASSGGPWFVWQVTADAAATKILLAAKSGTRTSQVSEVAIVEQIGALWITDEATLLGKPLPLNEGYVVCPYATASGFEILGVVPEMSASKGNYLEPPGEFDRCGRFWAGTPGPATITLRVGSMMRVLNVQIADS